MKQRHLGVLLLASLIACGDDGGAKVVDANKQPDAQTCSTLTGGMLDIFDEDIAGGFLRWGGPVTGDFGDGNKVIYQFEVYSGIESSLTGTIDLTQGNQNNYKTCAVCVRAFTVDAQGMIVKTFFQSGGSVTLAEDPFTNSHLVASVSNLQLQEVTIAMDYTSTPVAGGACGSLGTFTADHDKVPNAWTCAKTGYEDGTNCDCVCGTNDPDCASDKPTVGCTTTGDVCFNDACVTPPANDTCGTAQTLIAPTTVAVTGSTAGAKRDYSLGLQASTCTGFPQPGPDVVYAVTLTAATAYTFTLSGLAADVDLAMALVGPGTTAAVCDGTITTCVAGKDSGANGDDETFTYTPTATGTYYLIIDSFDANVAGAYTLNVTAI